MSDDASEDYHHVEYRPETDTYRATYSGGTYPPSTAVIEALIAITDRGLDDMDPLSEVVDTDALDALFRPTVDGRHRGDGEVRFTYTGYRVAVRSYGIIEIRELGTGGGPD